jgi:hypothetical protein
MSCQNQRRAVVDLPVVNRVWLESAGETFSDWTQKYYQN